MTRFDRCPHCKETPAGGLFGGYRTIYECKNKDCQQCYCDAKNCGNGRCPRCGSKERTKAGECYPK